MNNDSTNKGGRFAEYFSKAEKAAEKAASTPKKQIFAKCRERRLIEIRFSIYFVLHNFYCIPYQDIATHYGVNHATIYNGCRRVAEAEVFNMPLWSLMQKIIEEANKL